MKVNVVFQEISTLPLPPHRGLLKIPKGRGGGPLRLNILTESMKLKWNFQVGGWQGVSQITFPGGSWDISWNYSVHNKKDLK